MINNVTLVGRLTKELNIKHTSNGKAVASFTLAVNRQFTKQNGEREADFVSCVIWNKAAENLAKFTHKGSLIGIEGRLQTRSYDNSQQQRVYVTEVVAGNFSLLESKAKAEKPEKQETTFSTLPDVNYDPHGPGETVEDHDDGYPF